jgi:type IV secretory pathway component VirB8
MELENFFGNRQQDRRFDHDNGYQDNPRQTQNFRYPDQRHNSNFRLEYFLEKLRSNRKLKGLLICAFLLLLVIVFALIAIFLPLILKFLNYISENGVQGILDSVTGFLDKLWKGSGK